MSTWYDDALQIIAIADGSAPAAASVKERRKFVNTKRPPRFEVTSWGRKMWAKAKRDYFAKFEAEKPAIVITDFGPSPLERARQKAALAK